MKCLREFHRVTNAVKEIGITEGDVLRPAATWRRTSSITTSRLTIRNTPL